MDLMDPATELAICTAAYLILKRKTAEKRCAEIAQVQETSTILVKCEEEREETLEVAKKKKKPNPKYSLRITNGEFHRLHGLLRVDEAAFKRYYRMPLSTFEELLNILREDISHTRNRADILSPEEQLSTVLRFLGSGIDATSLGDTLLICPSTIGIVVKDVCTAICERLRPVEMASPTKQEWLKIADDFFSKLDFPQCLGAIGGKYIKTVKPSANGPRSRDLILLAVVDANHLFRIIDIGSYGKKDDDAFILMRSELGRMIHDGSLEFPEKHQFPMGGAQEEFFMVANESFPLQKHIKCPFSGVNLSTEQLQFNARLSKARKTVDYAFDMLTKRWQILTKPLNMHPEKGVIILQACCLLQNFIHRREGKFN